MTGPNPGHAWRAALVAVTIVNTAIVAVPGASNAQATAMAGSAYGYLADVTVPITGGAVRGPAPLATLPPGGTQSVSSASVIAGPATLFTSGPITVKSQATPGPAWLMESSVDIQTVNTSGQEVLTAASVQSLCRAGGTGGTSGSTTITNGTLQTDSGLALNDDDDYTDPGEHAPVTVPVPTTPVANTVITGHIHIGDVIDHFRYVFNEQIVNPDGSITVNAGHLYMLGPAATGDLIIGQSVCGPARAGARYNAVTPARILDTRVGNGAPAVPVGPGEILQLQVTGRGGVPDNGVSAVALNVTVTQPTATSFLTVFPTGEGLPVASNINFTSGQTVANLVKVKVGAGGKVSLFNGAGTVHVLADVAGWYGPINAPSSGSRYNALTPSRILDTRVGNGAPTAPMGPGSILELQVAGRGGVPETGVSAVVLNVTVTQPSAEGFLTAFPTGEGLPVASNVNFAAGATVPNLVIVKVGTGGKVSLYNGVGTVHVLADVAGWYDDGTAPTGARYTPVTPARLLDTRVGKGAPTAPIGSGSILELQVTGRGAVPPGGVTAVVLNVTVTQPSSSGFLTVFPTGENLPVASNLNFTAGQTVANLVVVKVGAGGKVSFFNAAGTVEVLADVAGWFDAG